MKYEIQLKGWWGFIAMLGVVGLCVAIASYFGDSTAMRAWLETPIREAKIRDMAILLIAAAIVAK